MATKKVGKATMRAARKGAVSVASKRTLPMKGDAVWVGKDNFDTRGILGIFVGYSARDRVVTLQWPGSGFITPYAWPEGSQSIFDVERENIKVLSPEQILAKIDWLIRVRDEQVRGRIVSFVSNNIGTRFFPDL